MLILLITSWLLGATSTISVEVAGKVVSNSSSRVGSFGWALQTCLPNNYYSCEVEGYGPEAYSLPSLNNNNSTIDNANSCLNLMMTTATTVTESDITADNLNLALLVAEKPVETTVTDTTLSSIQQGAHGSVAFAYEGEFIFQSKSAQKNGNGSRCVNLGDPSYASQAGCVFFSLARFLETSQLPTSHSPLPTPNQQHPERGPNHSLQLALYI